VLKETIRSAILFYDNTATTSKHRAELWTKRNARSSINPCENNTAHQKRIKYTCYERLGGSLASPMLGIWVLQSQLHKHAAKQGNCISRRGAGSIPSGTNIHQQPVHSSSGRSKAPVQTHTDLLKSWPPPVYILTPAPVYFRRPSGLTPRHGGEGIVPPPRIAHIVCISVGCCCRSYQNCSAPTRSWTNETNYPLDFTTFNQMEEAFSWIARLSKLMNFDMHKSNL